MSRCRALGFTLVEAMAGITIFSLVMVVLYAGYRLGMRSWESGEQMHDAISELRLAGSFIRRYTAQSYPLAINQGNAWRLWFDGAPQRLSFISAMPAHLGHGGMYEMTFSVDEHDDELAINVSRRLLHPDAERGGAGVEDNPRALLGGLDSARFEFYGATDDDAQPSWHTHWVAERRLPTLVRLRLASKAAGEWPDIVIRVPTNAVRYQRSAGAGAPGEPVSGRAARTGESLLAPGLSQ